MLECRECVLLRSGHAEAALTHAELRQELRRAILNGNNELVTGLILAESAALRKRDEAETAYRRHCQIAHSGGDAKSQSA